MEKIGKMFMFKTASKFRGILMAFIVILSIANFLLAQPHDEALAQQLKNKLKKEVRETNRELQELIHQKQDQGLDVSEAIKLDMRSKELIKNGALPEGLGMLKRAIAILHAKSIKKEIIRSAFIKDVEVSSPLRPFDSNGDLWFSTWADDNNLYASWGDGLGPYDKIIPQSDYSHFGLAKLTGSLPTTRFEVVKRFMPLSDDRNNSKPSSLIFYSKRLYAAIHSPLLYPEVGFIAYSDDYGKTFNFDLKNTPWQKGSNFLSLMFINMGKNYQLNTDGYVYAFGIGSEINWKGPVYLARVAKDSILEYSAWEYFIGIDKEDNPTWSKDQFKATKIKGLYTDQIFSCIYHPGVNRYIILTARFGEGELYEAPNPWGPWALAGKWFEGLSSEWVTSYMAGIITKGLEKNSFYFAVSGRETTEGHPFDKKYKFHIGKITMVVNPNYE